MDVIAIDDLKSRAEEAVKSGQKWHFHLLTPSCKLNESSDFALILEANDETAVYYSNEAPKSVSKELAKLLHGAKTFEERPSTTSSTPYVFKKLLKRANELSASKTVWHHHMLYPGCTFNPQPKSWIIVLEDPSKPEPINCAFDYDPKEDIKLLEQLFYAQQQLA